MKSEDVINKIKTKGYWRILFEPVEIENLNPLSKCKELVEKNHIQMRGWDYPHFPIRIGDDSQLETGQNYYQGWIDWDNHIEFWRMYQSGQFVHYLALREDWSQDLRYQSMWRKEDLTPSEGEALGVTGTIFQITEIYNFLSRLCQDGVYKNGVKVSISLKNTENRTLIIESFNRVGFSTPKKTVAKEIPFEQTHIPEEIIKDPNELALQIIVKLFQIFQWEQPNIEVIKSDQEKLISGRL